MAYINVRVPREVAKAVKEGRMPARDLSALVKDYYSQQFPQTIAVSIDSQPAESGNNKTQEQWINYFNEIGKKMISASDLYLAVKTASKEALDSLRKDFDVSWIVSSTRNIYNEKDLSAKIIHNYGSNIVKPKEKNLAIVPVYRGESAVKVVEGNGLPYVQALFDTKDKPNKILDGLSELSQKAPEEIAFWTPDKSSINSNPERAVGFGGSGGFRVYGDFLYNSGRSRGVSVKSANPTQKK